MLPLQETILRVPSILVLHLLARNRAMFAFAASGEDRAIWLAVQLQRPYGVRLQFPKPHKSIQRGSDASLPVPIGTIYQRAFGCDETSER
jgi:hypothetical protein